MCHNRTMNNQINRLHEGCLRLVQSDKQSFFEAHLLKYGFVSFHHTHLQMLATERY